MRDITDCLQNSQANFPLPAKWELQNVSLTLTHGFVLVDIERGGRTECSA
jgi:hypothetical protein